MSLEKKLARALQTNNHSKIEKVFEEIYYEYGKLVGFVISKYVHNKADVEELVNDVFLAFSKVMFNTEIGNIKRYLAVSAKNATVNFLRRKKIECEEFSYVENYDGYGDGLGYYDIAREMQKCLSIDELNTVFLHIVYGYSFTEIAKSISRPSSSVSSQYHRAIKKLKSKVNKNEI